MLETCMKFAHVTIEFQEIRRKTSNLLQTFSEEAPGPMSTGRETISLTLHSRSQLVSIMRLSSDYGTNIRQPTVRPWTAGKWQSYGFAKIWEGTARIPNEAELWRQYNSTRWNNFRGLYGTGPSQGEPQPIPGNVSSSMLIDYP